MATTITVTEDVTEVTVTETTTQLNITPQVTTVGVSAVDITAANTAQSVSLTPTGNISATNVQAGFNELASEVAFLSGADFTGDVTISNGELTVNGKVEAELFQGDIDGAVHFKGAVASGATLTKGDVVYISGHSGNKTEVDKADASDSNKMPAFGIVAADPVGQNVDVVTFGTLKTINASAYSEGDELYVSTTAGQLTSTAPSGEGNLVQIIAKVVRAGNSGNIKIMGAGRINATPNLNDGNIFIGDSNNKATTASFATQVASADITESQITDLQSYLTDYTVTESDVRAHESAIEITESQITNLQSYLTAESDPVFSAHAASGVTATKISNWDAAYNWDNHAEAGYLTSETSHTDVVVDGDFTSAGFMKRGASAGTYEIASTIAFTDLDCVKDEDDMTSDSAIHVPTQQSVKAFVEDQEKIHIYTRDYPNNFSLSSSYLDIFEEFETPTYTEKRLHEIDIHLHLLGGSTTVANNGSMLVEAEVPTTTTVFSLGNATRYGGGEQTYTGILQVDGDITDQISDGGSISLSTNPSGSFSTRSIYGVYYDRASDKTRIEYSEYPSALISNTDDPTELFHDPFRFSASGTFITVEDILFNVYAASQDTQQKVTARFGYISQGFKYRVRMREQSGSDGLFHRKVKYKVTSRKL